MHTFGVLVANCKDISLFVTNQKMFKIFFLLIVLRVKLNIKCGRLLKTRWVCVCTVYVDTVKSALLTPSIAPNGFSTCRVPCHHVLAFPPHFLKIVVEVNASRQPHVL